MHSDDRIVHDTGDDAPVVRDVEAEAEAELTDAEKIKADGIDEQERRPPLGPAPQGAAALGLGASLRRP